MSWWGGGGSSGVERSVRRGQGRRVVNTSVRASPALAPAACSTCLLTSTTITNTTTTTTTTTAAVGNVHTATLHLGNAGFVQRVRVTAGRPYGRLPAARPVRSLHPKEVVLADDEGGDEEETDDEEERHLQGPEDHEKGHCRDASVGCERVCESGEWHDGVWVGEERGTLADWPRGDVCDVGQYIARACAYKPHMRSCKDVLLAAAVCSRWLAEFCSTSEDFVKRF